MLREAAPRATSPTIAAVIPVSNKVPHVGAALASVLAQTRPPEEIIAIDDASTDGSAGILAACRDPRMRVLTRTEPGPGGYAARNLGIRAATADWIAFLDADDLWYPDHLATLASLIDGADPGTVGVFTGYERIWLDGRRQRDVFSSSRREPALELDLEAFLVEWVRLGASPVGTSASCFRRDALHRAGLFPENRCRRGGDLDTWLRLMALGKARAAAAVTAGYRMEAVNQVTRTESRGTSPCLWATLEQLQATATSRQRRLLAELRDVTDLPNYVLRASMARYTPIIGDRRSLLPHWMVRTALWSLASLPFSVQRAIGRLTRRARARSRR